MRDKIKALLKDRQKLREIVLYLIFGVLTTAVNWVVYMAVTSAMGLPAETEGTGRYALIVNVGQILGWILSVLFAFFTNKKFVFESKATAQTGGVKEFLLFVSARVASLLIFDLALFNVLLLLGLNDKWDKLLMNVLVVIFNYVASRFVVFRQKGSDT